MINLLFRIIIHFTKNFLKTDNLSDKFPVATKAIIMDDNRYLFLKNERNEWDFPGGKINYNEDIETCLKREVLEETNLSIKNLNIIKPLKIKINEVYVLILVYTADISCDSPLSISFEHSEYNFFSKSEITNLNMNEDYKFIINNLI